MTTPVNKPKKVYNFDKFWRFCPVSRPTKEALKMLLFTMFPLLFRNWAVFENWKCAQTFRPEGYSLFSMGFLAGLRSNRYQVSIPVRQPPKSVKEKEGKLAVVIHAFYADVFKEILETLNFSEPGMGLFITTSPAIRNEIGLITADVPVPCRIMTVENHGRDILPFLNILPMVMKEGYDLVLKLHTKKSNHLNRKELWRHHLIEMLIGSEAISRALAMFKNHAEIGMIGPAGHILPMHLYYGANGQTVTALSRKMKIDPSTLRGLCFAAGSMFYARTEVLKPLLMSGLQKDQFEPEDGQVDGTLAHAVERAFALGLNATGMFMADTGFQEEKRILTINRNHYFSI